MNQISKTFVISIVINVVIIVLLVFSFNKLNTLNDDYTKAKKDYNELTTKYLDLEKQHDSLQQKYKMHIKE